MKKLIFIFSILFSLNATAQGNSQDSTITVQLPQYFAQVLSYTLPSDYVHSGVIDAVRVYAGSGTRPDSLFTVTAKVKFIWPAIDYIMSSPSVVGYTLFAKYILNQRIGATGAAINGYTALRTQILNKSALGEAGAQWLKEQYLQREAALIALDGENTGLKTQKAKEGLQAGQKL